MMVRDSIRKLLNFLGLVAKVLVIAAIVSWLADWAIFRIRAAHGDALQTMQIQEYLSTSLKGNKDELDYMGVQPMSCARSLYPHAGAPPCWWLRRHPVLWE